MQVTMRLPRSNAWTPSPGAQPAARSVVGISARGHNGMQVPLSFPSTHARQQRHQFRGARCAASPDTEQGTSTRENNSSSADEAGGPGEAVSPATSPDTTASSSTATPSSKPAGGDDTPKRRIARTMADLDALLGIVEEPEAKAEPPATPGAPASSASSASATSSSDDVRRSGEVAKGGDIDDQFQKIIDRARALSKEQSGNATNEAEQAALKKEFESLLEVVTKPKDAMDKAEVAKLKEAVFGPLTFWVTETRPIQEAERTGLLIRGNLRAEREEVFAMVVQKVQELFNGKYQVFMVEDLEAEDMGGSREAVGRAQGVRDGPRIAFQIIPTAQVRRSVRARAHTHMRMRAWARCTCPSCIHMSHLF